MIQYNKNVNIYSDIWLVLTCQQNRDSSSQTLLLSWVFYGGENCYLCYLCCVICVHTDNLLILKVPVSVVRS